MYLIDSSHNSKCIHNNLNSHSPACIPPPLPARRQLGQYQCTERIVQTHTCSQIHILLHLLSPPPTPQLGDYWYKYIERTVQSHTHVPVLCCSCTPIHILLHPSTHFPTPLARRQLGRYQCIGRTVLTVVVWGLFWHSAYYLAPLLSSFANRQLDLKTKIYKTNLYNIFRDVNISRYVYI